MTSMPNQLQVYSIHKWILLPLFGTIVAFLLQTLSVSNCLKEIKTTDGYIFLDSLSSIWWRRPVKFRLDDGVTDPEVQDFCLRECDHFFKGVLNSTEIPIINSPIAESAARKPLQLKVAQKVGLKIPKTLMSNDPEEIRAFLKRMGDKCIYKPFTSPTWQVAETRVFTEEDLKYLDKLRHAPIIVQEKIQRKLDIRVNIFWENVFAASTSASVAGAEVDWRLDVTTKWEEHILPSEISKRLILLLRMLGLHYGCIDLIQQPDGTYVFLEVNPSGQFLFIEMDTGQPLSKTLAELLLHPKAAYSLEEGLPNDQLSGIDS